MELSEVVSNAILSAYNGGLLNVNLSSPPAGEALGPSCAATSPVLTSNDALLFHEKCGTLIKLSNNNKTAERRRPLDEFNNGVVMTNRPLRDNEMFEVRRRRPGLAAPRPLGAEDGLDPRSWKGGGWGRTRTRDGTPFPVFTSPPLPSNIPPRSASTSSWISGRAPLRWASPRTTPTVWNTQPP